MSIHHVERAAVLDLHAAKKLVFMSICDSADRDTGLGFPGFDAMQEWSGLGKSRVHETIAELIDAGLLARISSGRKGKRAVFRVFDQVACCPMHDPMGTPRIGSGGPDSQAVDKPVSRPDIASGGPDPDESIGSSKGSGIGSGLDRTPTQYPSSVEPAATRPAAGRRHVPVENLPPEVSSLRSWFGATESLRGVSFARLSPVMADTLAVLVKRHGEERMTLAVRNTHNPPRWVQAFLDDWEGLSVAATRPANAELCPSCSLTVAACDARTEQDPDWCARSAS